MIEIWRKIVTVIFTGDVVDIRLLKEFVSITNLRKVMWNSGI